MTRRDHGRYWAAIVADLGDPSPWLIYADRLEELGEHRLPDVMRGSRIEFARFRADGSAAFDLIGEPPLPDHSIVILGDGTALLRVRSAPPGGMPPPGLLAAEGGDAQGEAEGPPPPGAISPARALRAPGPRRGRG